MGISTKTVYKHFGSKEELLSACLKLMYDGYFNELSLILSTKDNAVNKLLILFRSAFGMDFGVSHDFFHDLNYYYPELQNAAINRTKENYGGLIILLIQNGIDEEYFISYIKPQLVLIGIVTLYTSITRTDTYKELNSNPHELFKNPVEVYMRGMCTEKGIKIIESNPYHKD